MRTKYFFKAFFILMLCTFFGKQAQAQFRIVQVFPITDKITIKNIGSTTENIADYRFCSLFDYTSLGSFTVESGSLNLAPNQEVVLVAPNNYLNDTAADLGLYLPTGNFGTAANMVDFMQYGAGGLGRESVAVMKGIWTAGTFINLDPPYNFFGEDTDFGVNFWETVLGINEFNNAASFRFYPNPTNSNLNIELSNGLTSAIATIYDVLGKEVINQNLESERLSTIDVSRLKAGLYLVRMSSNDKSEIKQFVKI